MTATTLRDAIFDRLSDRFFYGWVILAVAGLGIFASGPGQSHNFSVFIGPISDDLGISKATIASAYGIATVAAAFLLPKMGLLLDRFGARRTTLVVITLLGLACMAFGGRVRVPLAGHWLRRASLLRPRLADAELRQYGLAVVQSQTGLRPEPHGARLRRLHGRPPAAGQLSDRRHRLAVRLGRSRAHDLAVDDPLR